MDIQLVGVFPVWMEYLFQLVMVVMFGYMLYHNHNYRNPLNWTLILIWFPRIFDFFGKNAQNMYKIMVLMAVIYCYVHYRAKRMHTSTKDRLFTTGFIIFSISLFISSFWTANDSPIMVLSQYSRYLVVYLMYFVLREAIEKRNRQDELLQLLMRILSLQIIFAIIRFALHPHPVEAMVGSLCVQSGGYGTMLPLVGFVLFWIYRKGELKGRDWLYVIGLLFVGFVSYKRTVMILLPMVVAIFFVYVRGIKISKYVLWGIFALPLLLYLALRLMPSLNPENKVWGSFDLEYAWNYANTYQFGKEGIEGQRDALMGEEDLIHYANGHIYSNSKGIKAEGRGGATIALIQLLFGDHPMEERDIWGIGFSNMYGVDYEEFSNLPLTIKINHKGSATGLFQTYVTMGAVGVFATMLFCFMPFFFCTKRRYQHALLLIAAYDYFMYSGLLFRTPALMVSMLFIIIYINNQDKLLYHERNRANLLRFTRGRTVESSSNTIFR